MRRRCRLGKWRQYEAPERPDPAGDDGLLFQDAPHLPELLRALGPYYGSLKPSCRFVAARRNLLQSRSLSKQERK